MSGVEPTQAPLRLRINHVIYAKVEAVRESDLGGWWVHFTGSRESIYFPGNEKPYELGEAVKITFEKVNYAIVS